MADFQMITDGRVFSGDKARQLGLVDQTGLLEDAIDLAKNMAHVPMTPKWWNTNAPTPTAVRFMPWKIAPIPKSNVLQLELPDAAAVLPSGFYYMWKP